MPNELSAKQRDWVGQVSGVSLKAAEFAGQNKKKAEIVSAMALRLHGTKDEINEESSYEIKKGKKVLKSKSDSHDPDQEIDTWADVRGTTALTPAQLERVHAAQQKVLLVEKEMRNAKKQKLDENGVPMVDQAGLPVYEQKTTPKLDDDGKPVLGADGKPVLEPMTELNDEGNIVPVYEPLFSDKEIMDEVWTPLMREGIIPENAIPDRFSKTKQVFDKSNELYNKRLEEFTANQPDNAEILEKLEFSKEVSTKLVDIGAKIAKLCPGEDAKLANGILDGVKLCMDAGFGVAKGVIEKKADGIVDAIGDAIEGAFAPFNEELGKLVSKGFVTMGKAGEFGVCLAKGETEDALEALGACIAANMALYDTGDDTTYEDIGSWIEAGFKSAAAAEKMRVALMKPGGADMEAVMGACLDVATIALQKVKEAQTSDEADAEEDKEKKKEIEDDGEEAVDDIEDKMGEFKEGAEILRLKLSRKLPAEVKEKVEKELQEKENENAKANIDKETRAYQEMIVQGFSVANNANEAAAQDALKEQYKIENLIIEMKKDQMILDMAQKVMGSGIDIAAKFVPALGAVSAAKDMCFRLIAVAKRATELREWLQNVREASSASSAYGDAFKNRCANIEVKLSEDSIHAALDLARLIGAALSSSGLMAPIGEIVEKSADAGKVLTEVAFKVADKARAEAAWKIYKQALANPQNRKLAREAMRTNPTLAKYALVYGALEDHDANALNVMKKIGLNEKVLANESAGVASVMMYLETMFKDDPQLLKGVEVSRPWKPKGELKLTLACWLEYTKAAQTKATPKLEAGGNGAVSGAFAKLEQAEAVYADKKKRQAVDEACLDDLLAKLSGLISALESLSPKSISGLSHKEFEEHIECLVARATQRKQAMEAEKGALPMNDKTALGLLNEQIAAVEKCQHTDELKDLKKVLKTAKDTIKEIQGVPGLHEKLPVQSVLTQLETKLGPLSRLIANMEKEEE